MWWRGGAEPGVPEERGAPLHALLGRRRQGTHAEGDRSCAGVHQVGGCQGVRLQRVMVEDEEVDKLDSLTEQCCDRYKVGGGKLVFILKHR